MMETIKHMAKLAAQAVQVKADTMTGTELNAEDRFIPDFQTACEKENMLNRPVGFVCKSTAGRVVKLLQKYDSTIYTANPRNCLHSGVLYGVMTLRRQSPLSRWQPAPTRRGTVARRMAFAIARPSITILGSPRNTSRAGRK